MSKPTLEVVDANILYSATLRDLIQFFCELFAKDPALFVAAVHDQLDALRNPPHTLDDLLGKLRQEHIVQLCARLEAYQREF